MKKERIDQLIREGKLKKRSVDIPRIKSLIESSKANVKTIKLIEINEMSSTSVFREYYESVRQLGDARWWCLGYEPTASHEVSMEILTNMDIKEGHKLQKLDWFRRIRNNANYRGYRVNVEEAKEIEGFWNSCSKEIIEQIGKSIE